MTLPSTVSPLGHVEAQTLSNGAQLIYKAFPSAPRMALYITIDGGNRVEKIPGLADLADSLLNQGTHTRDAESIALAIDDIPMDLDIDTQRDYTSFSAAFLPEDLNVSVDLIADLLFNSTMADWEREKVRTQGEITMVLDSPSTLAKDMLTEALMTGLPYQGSLQNTLRSLPLMDSQALFTDHYQRLFTPQNMTIVAVGPIPAETIAATFERAFSGQKAGERIANENPVQVTPLAKSDYLRNAKNDSQQLHLVQGWFGPHFTDPDHTAMVILNTVLGGAGLSSRLFTEIRDKQGLAYNVRSQLDCSRYIGVFSLYIGTEPKNRERCLAGFAEEIRKLIEIPLTPEELRDAKENTLGRHVVFLEKASQQAGYIGSKLACGATLEHLQAHRERVQRITADDVQRVAERFLSKPSIVAAVGPAAHL